MNGVTEGIDAIATTRVVIRVENSDMVAGEISQRTFRYAVFTLLCFQVYLNVSNMNLYFFFLLPVGLGQEWI